MDAELSYLEDYLREEFSNYPELRIRVISPSGTARSVDLEQDYDESTGTVHRRSGVLAKTERSEWFFPREWILQANRAFINQLVEEIRSELTSEG